MYFFVIFTFYANYSKVENQRSDSAFFISYHLHGQCLKNEVL